MSPSRIRSEIGGEIADYLLDSVHVSPAGIAHYLMRPDGTLAALLDRAEQAEAENRILSRKLAVLAPHGTCACAWDRPDDVCAHHSPALSAALARIQELESQD